MSGWGCPNELTGMCLRVKGRACDPGMKGCLLHGRFVFSNPEKNARPKRTVLPSSTGGAERKRSAPSKGDTGGEG